MVTLLFLGDLYGLTYSFYHPPGSNKIGKELFEYSSITQPVEYVEPGISQGVVALLPCSIHFQCVMK